MTLALQEGLSVLLYNQHFRVLKAIPNQAVTLLNERTSNIREISRDVINGYIQEGSFKVLEGQDIIKRADGLPPIPAALPEHHRAELYRRLQYVITAIEQTTAFSNKAQMSQIATAVASTLGDFSQPSPITFYRWCRTYTDSGQDIMSLVPRTANSGRRCGQVADEVIELFFDIVDEFFLTRAKMSRSNVHAVLVDRVLAINAQRDKANWLRPISFNAFCRWIKERIDPFLVMRRREGVAFATRYFRRRDRGPSALFPMERIEIDHTVLDVLIVHPITRALLGRPTCTVAIDRRTRMVVAIYLDLAPPSSVAVLMCLRQAVESKQGILQQIGCESMAWPVEGRMQQICIDNGPEFHGNHFKRFCGDLAVDIQYCPPGKPWYKGAVERFLRTLNLGLIHSLPGTTRSNPRDRGSYPSEKLASLTLDELRNLVWKWVVVEYHNRRHSELGETPLQAWNALIEEHPIPKLPESLQLEVEASLSFEVAVRNGRVQAKGLVYEHPYLVHLQERLDGKTMLRVNPDDVTQAYLYDPNNRSLIQLNCLTDLAEPGMCWLDFQTLRKRRNDCGDQQDETIRRARVALIEERHQCHLSAEQQLKSKARSKTKQRGKSASVPTVSTPTAPNHSASPMLDDAWSVGTLKD
ncbi:Mu transposase C-terminal domain-containing protein [Deefgea sp. CFH1-16]|uniref:Mu transposase C-terminal domain-containing protein n=1 Tax=Deefgea sp. CFH1-16 TaxID=2675457 RepID=UPI0015F47ADD|nr:Mu transposase C-terminal domain-containing protein [Deefgea sp. CFH1-16]MBM5575315.1 DDE-type integrase/transposase/recombinase [Deefgea sp. CFH1-16]